MYVWRMNKWVLKDKASPTSINELLSSRQFALNNYGVSEIKPEHSHSFSHSTNTYKGSQGANSCFRYKDTKGGKQVPVPLVRESVMPMNLQFNIVVRVKQRIWLALFIANPRALLTLICREGQCWSVCQTKPAKVRVCCWDWLIPSLCNKNPIYICIGVECCSC